MFTSSAACVYSLLLMYYFLGDTLRFSKLPYVVFILNENANSKKNLKIQIAYNNAMVFFGRNRFLRGLAI